ncbi:MAG: PEP-CTERM sorting domain-containing protein [Candidatus Accumulibacter sp.]|uniref:PEP-CTERM sorting domain-containing protein n=1 Tax=Accumulibacter sp. TaxID=2053492 RepID=UPI001AC871BA|nr:PEP-CTERM sorting domain-containing protein [Accumulibacter sp.]MBN8518013.1 PEP-CTERM sorting domain-containing protein [Accumulibacter sp.]MBO3709010.1 PEP-CTERM sorting domain-containing protein [Accumulibacter sp.]
MDRRSIVFGLLLASFGGCIPQAYATPKPSLGIGADTSASDNGWGGGNTKSDLVDGKASYYDTWMHGLAAPLGQPTFHVVLDFASDTTFNSVVAWWHRDVGGHAVPNDVDIQIWNAVTSAWDTVFSTTNARDSLGPYDDPTTWTSRPTAFSFATVTSDKLLLVYDNLELWNQYREHGWLHEVSVYNESAVPEPGSLVLLGLGLAGLGYVRKRRS